MFGYASPLPSCSVLTPELEIGDSAMVRLFLFPNPSTGRFSAAIFSDRQTSYQVIISDMRGSKVYEKGFNGQVGYTKMDIDLGTVGNGMHILEVRDINGRRLAVERFMIRR